LINGDCANSLQVKAKCPAPTQTVGVGPDCDIHISITNAKTESTEFTLNGEFFTVPMIGEFNVRNAAMAICAARFGGLNDDEIRAGLLSFKGVKRRQTERGEKNGITIIDDFGHHPTAMRMTLNALRDQYPGRRVWAVFEPRSNTTRRAVFQHDLPEALGEADGVILAQVARMDQLKPEDRLDPEQVVAEIAATGKPAFYEAGVDEIIARLKPLAREGDVLVILSNGGFGGIHERLLREL
jgi:UDP-N-acetylmuramate: L-alanyl-gamma-D-glutamyl-meso-diaminopimelate ligase